MTTNNSLGQSVTSNTMDDFLDKPHIILTCPNCEKELILEKTEQQCFKPDSEGYYDIWSCENCSHIKVLDWRK